MLNNNSLRIKVPGKLMVAGEYAVLEPNQKLMTMAVDRFVYATIYSSDKNKLTLKNFDLINIPWKYKDGKVIIHSEDKRIQFAKEAMSIALTYVKENSVTLKPFTLAIQSELDDEQGIKYGLGSSAAVVVSVITAILNKHFQAHIPKQVIFKLAAIAHINVQGNGSGADIAASVYGGLIEYSSFQADWLKKAYANKVSLKQLVERDWKYLFIKQRVFPHHVYMYVGWTGTPAKTANLVDQVLSLKKTNIKAYTQFIKASEQAVQTIIQSIDEDDRLLFLKGVKQNREALSFVGQAADVEIETPLLAKLSDAAEQAEGAGKLSGAGGGDCGLAFLLDQTNEAHLLQQWEKANIKRLHLHNDTSGAIEV